MISLIDALFLDPFPFEVWIAKRTDDSSGDSGVKGAGTINDPYDGSTTAKFDAIMSQLPANTCVHLGPGVFTTKGYSDGPPVTAGWQIKAGMRIVGSGVDVTTLQLVDAQNLTAQHFAIGHALTSGSNAVLVPYCEVSDMTIDCKLDSQPGTQAAAGAIRLMGDHVRIRRVKVVEWGSKLASKPCMVLAVITADRSQVLAETFDAGIEECPATSKQQMPICDGAIISAPLFLAPEAPAVGLFRLRLC